MFESFVLSAFTNANRVYKYILIPESFSNDDTIGLVSNSDPSNHIRVHLYFTHYIHVHAYLRVTSI